MSAETTAGQETILIASVFLNTEAIGASNEQEKPLSPSLTCISFQKKLK